jgi:hypothetical protein
MFLRRHTSSCKVAPTRRSMCCRLSLRCRVCRETKKVTQVLNRRGQRRVAAVAPPAFRPLVCQHSPAHHSYTRTNTCSFIASTRRHLPSKTPILPDLLICTRATAKSSVRSTASASRLRRANVVRARACGVCVRACAHHQVCASAVCRYVRARARG